ncbi:MAG: AAA family ATPase [Bryobacteraceae bacterium]|nr:AAA family ATPase [Bryobacteraceae bacterium]
MSPNRAVVTEMGAVLNQVIPMMPVFDLQGYAGRPVLSDLVASQAPTLCFLDVSANAENAFNALADLLAVDPQIAVVALLTSNDPDLILRCLRQGATEFLLRPFNEEQFTTVMDRLVALRGGKGRGVHSRVVTLMPAKGACGATTIACNLAWQLRKKNSRKTLLADLDPIAGTVSFLMKLNSIYSFTDALSRVGTLDEDVWRGLMCQSSGVEVLLSPEVPIQDINEAHDPRPIVELARQFYDQVVIDTAGAYGAWSVALAQASDELLLVTSNELPALQAAQRALMYLDRNRVDRSRIRIVVNRFNTDVGLSQSVIETALHSEVYHIFPSEYDVIHHSLVEGKPVAPGSGFAKQLNSLVEKLVGKDGPPQPEAKKEAPKKASALSSLFSLFQKTGARA